MKQHIKLIPVNPLKLISEQQGRNVFAPAASQRHLNEQILLSAIENSNEAYLQILSGPNKNTFSDRDNVPSETISTKISESSSHPPLVLSPGHVDIFSYIGFTYLTSPSMDLSSALILPAYAARPQATTFPFFYLRIFSISLQPRVLYLFVKWIVGWRG